MLFVMALMINFGTMASWKVRSQVNTRYAATRELRDRTGRNNPQPVNWPANATLSNGNGDAVTQPNNVWNRGRYLTSPVIRGPVIAEPNNGRTITVAGRFEMHQEAHTGNGNFERKLPMLRSMMRNNGVYRFNQQMDLLDNRWEYRHLPMPRNPYDRGDVPDDGGNLVRRAKRWYRLDPPYFPDLQSQLQALMTADQRLKNFPNKASLDPLDNDDELILFQLRRLLGDNFQGVPPANHPIWNQINVTDFHISVDARSITRRSLRGCLPLITDPTRRQQMIQSAVNRVQRLPGRMARHFASAYQSEISRLQQLMPPPQGEIQRLQRLLDQVRQFEQSLPRQYR